jgi:hypothetical protein
MPMPGASFPGLNPVPRNDLHLVFLPPQETDRWAFTVHFFQQFLMAGNERTPQGYLRLIERSARAARRL